MPRRRKNRPNGLAYHVTFSRNLDVIAEQGLDPSATTGIATEGYRAHSRGKTFFTDAKGLDFWFSAVEQAAEHSSDNPLEEGFVPVVLSFVWPDDAELDEASDFGEATSYYTREIIEPEDLSLWDGRQWVDIDDWEQVDLAQAFELEPSDETDDGYLAWFKERSPLLPKD